MNEKDLATYKESARKRWLEKQAEEAQRRERAWALVRTAAALLKGDFGADRVVVFGSLVRQDLFHQRSDVDLAVWGLDEKVYYRAVGRLLALDPVIEVDLIMAEDAPAALLAVIEKEEVVV